MQITDKNKIYIGGLPFTIKYEDKYLASQGYSVRSTNGRLLISTKEAYPKARREKYILQSAGIQLLSVAGAAPNIVNTYGETFGNALYEFLISNAISWVAGNSKLPNDVIIGGLVFTIRQSEEDNALLEAGEANGEISYNDLEIRIKTTLPYEYKSAALCHEIIHGILYESRFPGDPNDESVVLPLGSLFYNFLRDNPILDINYPNGDVKTEDNEEQDDTAEASYKVEVFGYGIHYVEKVTAKNARHAEGRLCSWYHKNKDFRQGLTMKATPWQPSDDTLLRQLVQPPTIDPPVMPCTATEIQEREALSILTDKAVTKMIEETKRLEGGNNNAGL